MDISWSVILPSLVLLVTASVGVLVGTGLKSTRLVAYLSLGGVLLALLLSAASLGLEQPRTSFGTQLVLDRSAAALSTLILVGALLALLVSFDPVEDTLGGYEYYPLMVLSTLGALVMALSADFVTLLLGLEILSLPVYVLSAWRQRARESEEAGMKYFLLGAFASAFLIYGIALMYGATGHFTYLGVVDALSSSAFSQVGLATLAGALILAGLGFKAAFVPFHQWAPDVYTGAPMPVTAFMSVVVKAGAFAALVRVMGLVYPSLNPALMQALAILVALTIVIGNFAALVQTRLKRLLAYSAVAHAGYLGLALLSAERSGTNAVVWYLFAYTFMTLGAFAVLSLLTDKSDQGDDIERLAGLGKTRPYLAVALALFLLSLTGLPPMAGFISKILVFQAALEAGYVTLAVVAILMSVVAAYYYLRIVFIMYFRDPEQQGVGQKSTFTGIAIGVAALATVLLGLFPGMWTGILEVGQRLAGP